MVEPSDSLMNAEPAIEEEKERSLRFDEEAVLYLVQLADNAAGQVV